MKAQYETQLGIAATTIFTATMILSMFVASNKSINMEDKSESPASSYVSNESSTTHTDVSLAQESSHSTFNKIKNKQ